MLYLASEDTAGLSSDGDEDKATKNTHRPRKGHHRAQSRRLCVSTRHSHSYARWRKLETPIDLYHPDLRPTRRKDMPNYGSWKMSRATYYRNDPDDGTEQSGHIQGASLVCSATALLSSTVLLSLCLQSFPFFRQHRKGELITLSAIEPKTLFHVSILCRSL